MDILQQSDIFQEIEVDADGKGWASRRGAARLVGKSEGAIRKLLISLRTSAPSKCLVAFAGQDFEGAEKLPDILVAAIVQHYALKGSSQAIATLSAFAAIGIRTWMQKGAHWEADRNRQIVELLIQEYSTPWQRRFDENFYDHLYRFYPSVNRAYYGTNRRPQFFGRLTNELVYSKLPDGVHAALKQCQKETGGWDKLHQFLSEDGIRIFDAHMVKLLGLMASASSIAELRRLLQQSITGVYQLQLVG